MACVCWKVVECVGVGVSGGWGMVVSAAERVRVVDIQCL